MFSKPRQVLVARHTSLRAIFLPTTTQRCDVIHSRFTALPIVSPPAALPVPTPDHVLPDSLSYGHDTHTLFVDGHPSDTYYARDSYLAPCFLHGHKQRRRWNGARCRRAGRAAADRAS